MASWSSLVLCTVDDVRQRLTSPEIVLQFTKATNLRIGYVVVSNTFTTGVPHGFTVWTPVVFENTGGSFPSPIIAGTTYYVTSTGLTASQFKITDVIGGSPLAITTSGTGTNVVYNASLDIAIQNKIALSKRWLYDALHLDMQTRVPQMVDTWLAYKRWQTENLSAGMMRDLELLNRVASLPNVGGWFYDGSSFDLYLLLSLTLNLKPRTFSWMGAPVSGVSGTFAGQVSSGDMLIDGLNQMLYVNRSTDINSPLWVTPTVELVLDNILNPTQLVDVAVDYTLWAMSQDGMFRNRPSYDDAVAAGFSTDTEAMWMKRCKQRLKEITPLLKLDLDGDGQISNFELGMVINEVAAFA